MKFVAECQYKVRIMIYLRRKQFSVRSETEMAMSASETRIYKPQSTEDIVDSINVASRSRGSPQEILSGLSALSPRLCSLSSSSGRRPCAARRPHLCYAAARGGPWDVGPCAGERVLLL